MEATEEEDEPGPTPEEDDADESTSIPIGVEDIAVNDQIKAMGMCDASNGDLVSMTEREMEGQKRTRVRKIPIQFRPIADGKITTNKRRI